MVWGDGQNGHADCISTKWNAYETQKCDGILLKAPQLTDFDQKFIAFEYLFFIDGFFVARLVFSFLVITHFHVEMVLHNPQRSVFPISPIADRVLQSLRVLHCSDKLIQHVNVLAPGQCFSRKCDVFILVAFYPGPAPHWCTYDPIVRVLGFPTPLTRRSKCYLWK